MVRGAEPGCPAGPGLSSRRRWVMGKVIHKKKKERVEMNYI
tara:strand:- start:529 stop:651 length:123 start_codon:yes stop_codon:yes gene_type:complete